MCAVPKHHFMKTFEEDKSYIYSTPRKEVDGYTGFREKRVLVSPGHEVEGPTQPVWTWWRTEKFLSWSRIDRFFFQIFRLLFTVSLYVFQLLSFQLVCYNEIIK